MKVKYYKCKYCGRIFKSESMPHIPHNCKPGFRKRHLDFEEMKILHLVLKGKWYDMIESGEKKEEYRKMKYYWGKRLLGCKTQFCKGKYFCQECGSACIRKKEAYKYICFHRGYTSTTITVELKEIKIGRGNIKWGAMGYNVWILKLGERIK